MYDDEPRKKQRDQKEQKRKEQMCMRTNIRKNSVTRRNRNKRNRDICEDEPREKQRDKVEQKRRGTDASPADSRGSAESGGEEGILFRFIVLCHVTESTKNIIWVEMQQQAPGVNRGQIVESSGNV